MDAMESFATPVRSVLLCLHPSSQRPAQARPRAVASCALTPPSRALSLQYPVFFHDDNGELVEKGFVGIHSNLSFKRFQMLMSQKSGVPVEKVSMVFVCRRSVSATARTQHPRRCTAGRAACRALSSFCQLSSHCAGERLGEEDEASDKREHELQHHTQPAPSEQVRRGAGKALCWFFLGQVALARLCKTTVQLEPDPPQQLVSCVSVEPRWRLRRAVCEISLVSS